MKTLFKQDKPPTEVQTLIFDKEKFESSGEAMAWAREHDFDADKVDETESSFRLRQRDPDDFVSGSFRTIDIDEGIKGTIGRLKPALRKVTKKKEKKKPSMEYLEAALAQARKLLPGWIYAAIHRAAFPSSGGRAAANRRRNSAMEKAWIEKTSVESMQDSELRSILYSLHDVFFQYKRQGKDRGAIVSKALSVSAEMRKRGLYPHDWVTRDPANKQQPTATDVSVPVPIGNKCPPGQRYDSEQGQCVDEIKKGFLNGMPEGGMHAHGLDRRNGKTFNDGAHIHLYIMPGTGEALVTFEDGSHAHALGKGDATENDGAHSHKIELQEGQIIETKLAGAHSHSNMVETTGFDGLHKHTLLLPDGQTIVSLSPQQFVEQFKLEITASPIETASQVSQAMLEARMLTSRLQEHAQEHLIGIDEAVDQFAKTGILPALLTTSWEVEALAVDGAACLLHGMDKGCSMSNPIHLDLAKGDIVDIDHEGAIVGFSMSSEPNTADEAIKSETHSNALCKAVRTVDFVGPSDAKVVFVCATPSNIELARMEALVGPDGSIFKDLYLDPLGLKKSEVAIGFAIPVTSQFSDIDKDVERWRDYLVKSLAHFSSAKVVSFGRTAKAALGPIASLSLPHPAGVRRHGDSGEVGRKLKILAKSLDIPLQVQDHVKRPTGKPIQGQPGATLTDSISELRKDETFRVAVTKSLPEKQIVYGVVLDPYQVDLQNDWIPPAEIEATAHDFLEKSRVIGLKHRGMADAKLVESWVEIYPSSKDREAALANQPHSVFKRSFGTDIIHSGAWVAGVRLSDELWASYKTGELDAFSIGGFSFKSRVAQQTMPAVQFIDMAPLPV